MLEELRLEVYKANMFLCRTGLAPLTWGNVSGIDRATGTVIIKPSGVPYDELSPENLAAVDLEGNIVEGSLKPSSDTPTHLYLYKAFADIGGIAHTHSKFATAYAQAGQDILVYGTTHADFAPCPIPCTRKLAKNEVLGEYELNTGKLIAECFSERDISHGDCPAVLVKNHGPFTWGKSALAAAENSQILEIISEISVHTETIDNIGRSLSISPYLIEKHYSRKHGKNAYYGQKTTSEEKD